MQIAPVVLIKNEEAWIARVLRPLVAQFGIALVGDTGSTDATLSEAASVPGVEVIEMGPMDVQALGQARRSLGLRAQALGYDWIFQVDGDELYHPAALAMIAATTPPPGGQLGFTSMCTLDPDESGAIWELDDVFCRAAVMPADVAWKGEYPFEAPVVFHDPGTFFYYPAVDGLRFHALHLHRFQRSRHDDAVVLRRQKQFQFALQDREVPRVQPFDSTGWWRP
ncbi:MAG TPA: glycosyltransferase [Anaerolineae bacterium]|nr:glycosyltransferase [Anaerolineae bacterium]